MARTAGRRAALFAALALVAAGRAGSAAAPDWTAARKVTDRMVDFRFRPDRLDFRAGVAYRLRLVNASPDWHEFTAPQFAKAVVLRDPRALDPDLPVPPGQSRDLFFLAPKPGKFPFWCLDHKQVGMTGTITIR